MASFTIDGQGLTRQQKLAMAAALACKPCCRLTGGGSSPTSPGIPLPICGCAPCACCPGVCVWATNWHRLWTVDTPRYPNPLTPYPPPGPHLYTLVSYTAELNPDLPDWFYIGDVASDETFCSLAGLYDYYCITGDWLCRGTAVYNVADAWGGGYGFTCEFTYFCSGIYIQFSCDNPDGFIAMGYLDASLITDLGITFSFDGKMVSGGSGFVGTVDVALGSVITSDMLGIDTSSCAFTFPLGDPYPGVPMIPLYV